MLAILTRLMKIDLQLVDGKAGFSDIKWKSYLSVSVLGKGWMAVSYGY